MFYRLDCLQVVLTYSGSRPYDVSNDVIKSAILKISNNNISGTGRPIEFRHSLTKTGSVSVNVNHLYRLAPIVAARI